VLGPPWTSGGALIAASPPTAPGHGSSPAGVEKEHGNTTAVKWRRGRSLLGSALELGERKRRAMVGVVQNGRGGGGSPFIGVRAGGEEAGGGSGGGGGIGAP
jgi:hypothetical protein